MGLRIDPAHVIRIDAAGWSMKTGYHPMAPEIGYKPMQALLEKARDFTAIFCFNDIAAIGAIRALKEAGCPSPVTSPWWDSTTSSPPPTTRPRSPPCASRWPRWASAARRCCSSASPTAKTATPQRSSWPLNWSSANPPALRQLGPLPNSPPQLQNDSNASDQPVRLPARNRAAHGPAK